MDEEKSISWAVDFEICVNGEEVHFWELTEAEQKEILRQIAGDSYSGIL